MRNNFPFCFVSFYNFMDVKREKQSWEIKYNFQLLSHLLMKFRGVGRKDWGHQVRAPLRRGWWLRGPAGTRSWRRQSVSRAGLPAWVWIKGPCRTQELPRALRCSASDPVSPHPPSKGMNGEAREREEGVFNSMRGWVVNAAPRRMYLCGLTAFCWSLRTHKYAGRWQELSSKPSLQAALGLAPPTEEGEPKLPPPPATSF